MSPSIHQLLLRLSQVSFCAMSAFFACACHAPWQLAFAITPGLVPICLSCPVDAPSIIYRQFRAQATVEALSQFSLSNSGQKCQFRNCDCMRARPDQMPFGLIQRHCPLQMAKRTKRQPAQKRTVRCQRSLAPPGLAGESLHVLKGLKWAGAPSKLIRLCFLLMTSGVDMSSKVSSVEYFAGDMAYTKAVRSSGLGPTTGNPDCEQCS